MTESGSVGSADLGRGERLARRQVRGGEKSILHLDCRNGYASVCMCQNSSDVILRMGP